MSEPWPKVLPNDDGIRPAGPANACFYCGRIVGQEHGRECVAVKRTIKARYTFEIEVDIPAFWETDTFEFARNESSWCANNAIYDLQEYESKLDAEHACFCGRCKIEYLGETDGIARSVEAEPTQEPRDE